MSYKETKRKAAAGASVYKKGGSLPGKRAAASTLRKLADKKVKKAVKLKGKGMGLKAMEKNGGIIDKAKEAANRILTNRSQKLFEKSKKIYNKGEGNTKRSERVAERAFKRLGQAGRVSDSRRR